MKRRKFLQLVASLIAAIVPLSWLSSPKPELTNLREVDIEDWGDYFDDEETEACHYCHGEGWGIIGLDWDCEDPINGPYDGETERCPCCNGSGKAEDCTFW